MVNHVPDVTRLLDRLEKAGLIARSRCNRDRRVVRSRLTPKGMRLVQSTEKPLAEAQRALLGGLTEGELHTLRMLLEKTSSDSGD
jgi:DNA-binding MarR family transcriptional regulator